jgi:predicted SprT family Zn-dependent metalloprotease
MTGEFTTEWEPAEFDFTCPMCKARAIQWRQWESSDGKRVDEQYRCLECRSHWWTEGPDE